MQRTRVASVALLALFAMTVGADDTQDLIALDKQWGESGVKGDMSVAEKLLAEQVVSVSPEGVRGRQGELADNESAPPGTRYEPTDYKVTFPTPDIAIMTHGTRGADAHYSLHSVGPQERQMADRRYVDDARRGCGLIALTAS